MDGARCAILHLPSSILVSPPPWRSTFHPLKPPLPFHRSASMPHPGLDVTNKVCLVTGGTSGIGRAIALGFAQAGAKVVAGSNNPDKVSAIKKELGTGHEAVTINVTDANSVANALDLAVKKLVRVA